MPAAVKHVALQPTLDVAPESQPATALVPSAGDSLVLMFERLARDSAVDVEKLERLIAMQERILAHNAKAAFEAAFSAMQPEIPEIDERGRIVVDGSLRSTYAKNEDIQTVLKPILAKHGFSLAFETLWPEKGVEVIGTLSHREGHSRRSMFKAGADTSGSKNAIQALASTVSYGHRYTTIDLLNIVSREPRAGADDDATSSEAYKAPEAPEGYDVWWAVLEGVAADGWKALSADWNKSKPEYRSYTTKHRRREWDELRAKAQAVR